MKYTIVRNRLVGVAPLAMAVALSACTSAFPPRDTSVLEQINHQMKEASSSRDKAGSVPGEITTSLLPPLTPAAAPRASRKQLEQRFDLKVDNASISQVLMGIVEGTPFSIMLKPRLEAGSPPNRGKDDKPYWQSGLEADPQATRLTVNLKNVTLFEALDSIREVYGYDYTVDGNRIYVQPPELQTRLYQVDYIIGQRRGVSDLQVIGGATIGATNTNSGSSGSTGSTGSTGTSGSTFSSVQATGLSTIAKSDIWGEIEDALRTTLGCQIPRTMQNTQRPLQSGGAGTSSSGGSGSGSGSSGTSSQSRADVSFTGDAPLGERPRGVDGCTNGRAMSISQMSGTVMVRGMPHEHRMVDKMLKSLQVNVSRQVIIEAKIIDVTLNADSQQGINWSKFNHGLHQASIGADTTQFSLNQPAAIPAGTTASGGSSISPTAATLGTTLGTALGTTLIGNAAGSAFTGGLGLALQFRNFGAMINFLQTQGEVQVLSSPRIATLNSQKAVIKVGTEEPFVSSIVPGVTNTAAGAASTQATAPSLNYQPFFSGISLDVTPKVDDKGDITLHVHALVNSIIEREKLASPEVNAARVPFAVNTINETDSVVKAKDGQVVVIGGLMTESMSDRRGKMPGVGDVPGLGALFSKGGQHSQKRELVILLKPTVVRDDAVWADDIAATQNRIEALGASRNVPVPSAPQ